MNKRIVRLSALSLLSVITFSIVSKGNILKTGADAPVFGSGAPVSYTDASSDEIGISVYQNTVTELSQFYTFSFQTAKNKYGSYSDAAVQLIVTDASFSGEEVDHSSDKLYPVYEAEVFSIEPQSNIFIPSTTLFYSYYKLQVTNIGSNILNQNNLSKITSIFIPKTITTIAADAFSGIPTTAIFKTDASADQPGWASGWNAGCQVNYDVTLNKTDSKKVVDAVYNSISTYNNGFQFILGNYSASAFEPLKLKYDVLENGSYKETRISEFALHSPNSTYDAVGTPIAADNVRLSISLPIGKNEKVDETSLVIQNFYRYSGVISNPIDNVSGAFSYHVTGVARQFKLSQFIEISPVSISISSEFTLLKCNVKTIPGIFEVLKPDIAKTFKRDLDSGKCVVRYRFTSISSSSYEITYKNKKGETKTGTLAISSPYDFYNLEKNGINPVGFLFKNSEIGSDFAGSEVLRVDLNNFFITVDCFNTTTNNKVSAAAIATTRFGSANLFDSSADDIDSFALDTIMIVSIIIAIALYAATAIILFFVYKRVFRNDEFRRLKPKQFIKKAIIYFIGYMFIFLSALFITFRWGFLNNSFTVFNPYDVFVIVFTIAGAISLGLFIKDLVVAIKAAKNRKQTNKLGLDKAIIDDGTK